MPTLTPVDNDPFATAQPKLTPVDHDPFAPPSPIAQPTDSLPGLNPLTATSGDYLAKLNQVGSGIKQLGQFGADYARSAANSFGLYDRAVASAKTDAFAPDASGRWIQGGTIADLPTAQEAALKEERAKTAAAQERLGTAGTIASNMTGAGPIAKLGAGTKIAEGLTPYVGRYLGGLVGGTGEGAAIGGASAAGRGEDVGFGTMIGALFGLGGSLPGGIGRGKSVPQAADRSALEADQAAKLAALKQPKFTTQDVDQAYRDAVLSLDPEVRGNISYKMRQGVIRNRAEIERTGGPTAASVNGFARKAFDKVTNSDDDILAAKIRDNLVGDRGVLATARPTTAHAPGEAFDLHNDFQTSTARLGDYDWASSANPKTAPAQAAAKLKPDSGMLYDQAGRDALTELASMQPKPEQQGFWPGVGRYLKGALADKTLGAGLGWLTGGLPGVAAPMAAQAGAAGVKGAVDASKSAAVQRAIDAFKVAATTGRPTTSFEMLPPAPVRESIRQVTKTLSPNAKRRQ